MMCAGAWHRGADEHCCGALFIRSLASPSVPAPGLRAGAGR